MVPTAKLIIACAIFGILKGSVELAAIHSQHVAGVGIVTDKAIDRRWVVPGLIAHAAGGGNFDPLCLWRRDEIGVRTITSPAIRYAINTAAGLTN